MKKYFILITVSLLSLIARAQYDPTNPSQRGPYAKQELAEIVTTVKASLPVQLDEITYLVDFYVSTKTGNIVYKYTIDDTYTSMDKLNMTTMRTGILTMMENDEASANLYWDAVVLKKNIVYLYVGYNSKKQKSVTIKYDEIRYMRKLAEWL